MATGNNDLVVNQVFVDHTFYLSDTHIYSTKQDHKAAFTERSRPYTSETLPLVLDRPIRRFFGHYFNQDFAHLRLPSGV